MRRVDRAGQAEALGELRDGRVAEDVLSVADDDGDLGGLHVEAVEEGLRGAIGVEVDVGMGMIVAGEELTDLEGAGRVARAHDHDSCRTRAG